MIEPGTYQAHCTQILDYGETASGAPYMEVMFTIDDTGEQIRHRFYFTEKTVDRSIEALHVMGMTDGLTDLTVEDIDDPVSIVVDNEEYNGKTYSRIKWINPPRKAGDNQDAKTRIFAALGLPDPKPKDDDDQVPF